MNQCLWSIHSFIYMWFSMSYVWLVDMLISHFKKKNHHQHAIFGECKTVWNEDSRQTSSRFRRRKFSAFIALTIQPWHLGGCMGKLGDEFLRVDDGSVYVYTYVYNIYIYIYWIYPPPLTVFFFFPGRGGRFKKVFVRVLDVVFLVVFWCKRGCCATFLGASNVTSWDWKFIEQWTAWAPHPSWGKS